jgi:hypothetical protein
MSIPSPEPILPTPCPGVLPLTPEREADLRARVVAAARSWIGTPYRQQGFVKGPNGAIDCAMLMVGAYVEAGVFLPFDPRPYPPTWYMHHSEERYLGWMLALADEVETPRPGDIAVWRFGRCFSHSGLLLDSCTAVVHASAPHIECCASDLSEAWLCWIDRAGREPRPRKVFSVFARLAREG